MHFSAKKFFLVGFVVLLLVGIPVSVYFLQQQQTIQQQAEKSTNFSFTPTSTSSNPITKNVAENIPLDVMVDPGTNVVSSVTIEITFDAEKLEAGSGSFVPDTTVFSTVLSPPTYTPGKIVVVLGIDSPNKALTTKAKAGTVTFKAKAPTDAGTPTVITFNAANSIATSRGPNDQALENVLSGTQPAYIAIAGQAAPTMSPTPTFVPTATPTSTEPLPTTAASPTVVPTGSTTPTAAPTTAVNGAPSCVALTADQTSGEVPLTVNFTANGTDSDGTITKVTFNFGDGQVSDVTSGGGIGSPSANVQLAHTYTSAGTFTASAILTDDTSGVSTGNNCSLSIAASGGATATATPTIAPSGSAEVLFGIGVASLIFIIGGALLFILL